MNLERIRHTINTEIHDRVNLKLGLILLAVVSTFFGINGLVNDNLGGYVALGTAALSGITAVAINLD
ncbi:MAG TPA: hypothetical protein VMR77_02715 [Patescibacteria group bacterium]|jgi:hypothetical protein|nr:hypothetical protein [Patescibacteria group bacterium]